MYDSACGASIICFGTEFHAANQVISMATGLPESSFSLGARAGQEHLISGYAF